MLNYHSTLQSLMLMNCPAVQKERSVGKETSEFKWVRGVEVINYTSHYTLHLFIINALK